MKKSTHLSVMIALIWSISPACAQIITGKVIESKESKPLYKAHIRINSKGTLTDIQGNFQLKLTEYDLINKNKISISFVGYKTQEISIASANKPLLIQLEENSKDLNEVIVSSSARGLVEEAIRKIPENYPNHPFTMRGIITEKNKQKRDENLYELKAIVSARIPSYQDDKKEIDTKIEAIEKKSSYMLDTIQYVKWTGTGKTIEYFDFVKHKTPAIDLKKTKNYQYNLQDVILNQGRPTYQIRITKIKPKKEFLGYIYIDQESMAFQKFSFFKNEDDSLGIFKSKNKTINQSILTEYKLIQSKWYLSEIKVSVEKILRSIPTFINVNFLATEYDSTNHQTLSYQEKYQDVDLLSNLKNTGTIEQWKEISAKIPFENMEYTKFEPLKTINKPKNSSTKETKNPFIQIPKVALYYGITTNLLTNVISSNLNKPIQLPHGFSVPNESITKTIDFPNFQLGIGVNLWKELQIGYEHHLGTPFISKPYQTANMYSLKYDFILNKKHRPFTISPIIKYGNRNSRFKLGEVNSNDHQKEELGLNDEKLNTRLESRVTVLSVELQIGLEINRKRYLQLGINYNIPTTSSKEEYIFSETSRFLFNKEKRLANQQPIFQYNNSFSVSLTYKLLSYAK